MIMNYASSLIFVIYSSALVLLIMIALSFQVHAKETVSESVQDMQNDAQREVQQKMNRLEEEACMKSETECLKERAANRLEETADAAADKYDEIKNVIDDD